jgi:glycosidase
METAQRTTTNSRVYGISGIILAFLAFAHLPAAARSTEVDPSVNHPEWSRNVSIYEVNLRQYSEGGTFKGFEDHLPRLKELGVGILWLMPIHPIGEKNRKGTLGSYYAVKNYKAVNPEHGTLEEFKSLVKTIHEMGMYVIIDWVANHCAWDNPLVAEHPDWFTTDENGDFVSPVEDWYDVVDFNYDRPAVRAYMRETMRFWVEETDIDGFRCDVAGMVPTDFWVDVRAELESIKPVFMLAEWESPELVEAAFDMDYAQEFHGILNALAGGAMGIIDIELYFDIQPDLYPPDAFRMYYTSNHDENSWNGSVFERLGPAAEACAVLTATVPGMPLVYSGQEAGLEKRLSFFEKDPIEWRAHPMGGVYSALLNLKKDNPALWNGTAGGEMVRVATSDDNSVFAFVREKDDNRVLVIVNLSEAELTITLEDQQYNGTYTDIFSGEEAIIDEESKMQLVSWGYGVFSRQP